MATRAETRAAKLLDERIEALYYKRCSGIQISIMDISKVFRDGREAAAKGLDDVALGDAILAFVNTIRKN